MEDLESTQQQASDVRVCAAPVRQSMRGAADQGRQATANDHELLTPISTQLIHPSLQACRAVVFGKSAQVSHTDRRGARRPRGCDLSANALSTVWSTHVSKGPAMSEIARDRTYVTGLSSLIVTTDQPSVPVTAE